MRRECDSAREHWRSACSRRCRGRDSNPRHTDDDSACAYRLSPVNTADSCLLGRYGHRCRHTCRPLCKRPTQDHVVVGRPSPGTEVDPEVASPAQLRTPGGTPRSSAATAKGGPEAHRTCALSVDAAPTAWLSLRRHTEVFRQLAAFRVECDLPLSTNPQVRCRHGSGLCLVTLARTWVPSGNPLFVTEREIGFVAARPASCPSCSSHCQL